MQKVNKQTKKAKTAKKVQGKRINKQCNEFSANPTHGAPFETAKPTLLIGRF
jgi:hypothetical protein